VAKATKKQDNVGKALSDKTMVIGGVTVERSYQIAIIQWLVEYRSYNQIVALLKEHFKIEMSRQAIHEYAHAKKWEPLIKKLRKRLEKNLLRIPCANKGQRLLTYQRVIEAGIFLKQLGAVNQALDHARIEIDGDNRSGGIHIHEEIKIFGDVTIEQINKMEEPELVADINNRLSKYLGQR